jgi:hypothetical protein
MISTTHLGFPTFSGVLGACITYNTSVPDRSNACYRNSSCWLAFVEGLRETGLPKI